MAVMALAPLFGAISSALSGAGAVTSAIGSAATGAAGAGGQVLSGISSSIQSGLSGGLITEGAPLSAAPAAGGATAGAAPAPVLPAPGVGPVAAATPAGEAPVTAVGGGLGTTAPVAGTPMAPMEVAKVGLATASLGLGTAQGVLAYQAGQDAKAAREAQARAELGSAELGVGQKYRQAARYLARIQAVAGAGNVAFGGSPALLGQEAMGIVGEEAATISRNAGRVSDMLRREGRAASLAGKIGLGTGIGGGLVGAGQTAMAVRVYG